jgi:hypothetical protein
MVILLVGENGQHAPTHALRANRCPVRKQILSPPSIALGGRK